VEPALASCWQILLCSYAISLSTLKKHPSYGAVHQPSLDGRFMLSSKASCPAGIGYKELLDALNIATPIIPIKIPTIPPWVIVIAHCNIHLCNLPKACTPTDTFRRLCSETHTISITVIFTDGSLMNGLTDCVFILNGKAFKFQLNSFRSICTVELLALCKAFESMGNLLPGTFLLCADSLSAIQGLQSPYLTHPLILDLCTTYHAFPVAVL
jgi:hypothetical protein